jgi:hypothetical protein
MNYNLIKSIFVKTALFLVVLLQQLTGSAQALSGDYSLGLGADYETFTAVIADLDEYGIEGPVVFHIEPGTYTEEFDMNVITGASEINTITFQSASLDSTSVILQYDPIATSGNLYTFWDVSFVHFKSISFKVLGDNNHTIFRIYRGRYWSISNCVFIGIQEGSSELIRYTNSSGTYYESFILDNNLFLSSSESVDFEGNFKELIITNNTFDGDQQKCLIVEHATNVNIQNNQFIGTTTLATLTVQSCDSVIVVQDNVFANESRLYFASIGGSPTSISKIRNNAIVGRIGFYNIQYLNLLNNSVHTTSVSTIPCLAFIGDDFFHLNYYNNIFAHKNGGPVIWATEHFFGAMFDSDNNCYYSTVKQPFKEETGGEFVYRNFEEWAEDKYVEHYGLFTLPNFVSDTNLHIDNASSINNKALPYLEVPLDFDDETRDLEFPDIGVDEFEIDSSTYRDIEMLPVLSPIVGCVDSDSIIIQLKNNSIFELDSFTVKWKLFETQMDSVFSTLNIPPNDSISIYLGDYDFRPNTAYELFFEVYLPNGEYDHYFDNNDFSKTFYRLNDIEIFEDRNAACIDEIELYLKNFPRASVLWSTGEIEDKIIIAAPGEYSVLITDQGGCEYSNTIIVAE